MAPIALLLTGACLALGVAFRAEVFAIGVLFFGVVHLVAHLLLAYRVHKFVPGLRLSGKLAGKLQLGYGYAEAREALRRGRSSREP